MKGISYEKSVILWKGCFLPKETISKRIRRDFSVRSPLIRLDVLRSNRRMQNPHPRSPNNRYTSKRQYNKPPNDLIPNPSHSDQLLQKSDTNNSVNIRVVAGVAKRRDLASDTMMPQVPLAKRRVAGNPTSRMVLRSNGSDLYPGIMAIVSVLFGGPF